MREWMGPTNFLGGQLPIERQGHGLVSLNDTKFALFAGTNAFFGDILPPFNNKFRRTFYFGIKISNIQILMLDLCIEGIVSNEFDEFADISMHCVRALQRSADFRHPFDDMDRLDR